jgi:hypothetical protein
MNGWLRLHRQILEWEWYSCMKTTRVFLHLLLTASWRNARWQGVEIPRGSVFASPETLATATGLTRQQVRTVITRLKSTNEITTKSTNRGTLITLCNFEAYNPSDSESNQQLNQQLNHTITSDQPAINQRLTTSEEGNKVKKERNKKSGSKDSDFELPIPLDFSAEVQSALRDWKEHRSEIKKKITATQWKRLLDDCRKEPVKMVAAIHKSVVSGWQGLFPESVQLESTASAPKAITADREPSGDWLSIWYRDNPDDATKPNGEPYVPTWQWLDYEVRAAIIAELKEKAA